MHGDHLSDDNNNYYYYTTSTTILLPLAHMHGDHLGDCAEDGGRHLVGSGLGSGLDLG